MLNKLGLSIITMFGIGYIKLAPGTFASLATCIIYFFLFKIIFSQIEINYLNYLIFFLILIFFIGIYLIDNVKNNFKKKDASEIVIDEFLGQSIVLTSLMFMPISLELLEKNIIIFFIVSFFLFRLFDITKPFPIGLIDKKIKSGFGIMLDDLVASFFSIICIYVIINLWF